MGTTDEHKAIARRYFDGLRSRWHLDLVEELIAPDVSFRGSLGVAVDGRTGFAGYVALVRGAFPDVTTPSKRRSPRTIRSSLA